MASSRASHSPSIGGTILTCKAEPPASTSQGMERSITAGANFTPAPRNMGPTRMSYAGDRRASPLAGTLEGMAETFCGECGHQVADTDPREPCPNCGSLRRSFAVRVDAATVALVGGSGSI